MSQTSPGVAIIIPAKDEQARIGATVRSAAGLPAADLVIVVDDGSTDRTAAEATAAGATVIAHPRNRGKAAAMETGAAAVTAIESRETARPAPRALLFLDADLEDSAAKAAPLIEPVINGEADMTIAVLPAQSHAGGGRGLVVDLSREGIARATGWAPRQPLSGQRCLTRSAFEAALPLAPGWGVETGLTIDLLRQGYRALEVDVSLHHRVTGTDWKAQVHRGKQYAGVLRALVTRGVRPSPPSRLRRTRA
ncbi:glycosyltransferase family 2 protein [Phytoactinopolyspora mesophila]|uniref:Glucosyl-3-phosphoglycerate synthase n=1 Tax=Phytoactinopolyspora mesophila TaxID=2650750 RepID=A0A7K3M427_9ACTN|nr:glycosyltransferase [Phytoactinopolyspora mesophila]NDL58073.1 glycosyltransferase [Phytoactinopolyspora mesophila]